MLIDGRKIVFLGTPQAAATILESLIESGFEIVHVITRPDARRGRGGTKSASAVKAVAVRHGISVSNDLSSLDSFDEPLLGIVVAYGRIIPARVLEKIPMLNVHFSLLPRWRGAAPVERAILAGDAETGVCIMDVEATLDTGAVYGDIRTAIKHSDTSETLTTRLASMGAQLLCDVLRADLVRAVVQVGEPTYAHKITAEDQKIDWSASAEFIDRQIRAVRAFTAFDGQRVKILKAEIVSGDRAVARVGPDAVVGTGDGALMLVTVAPEGRPAMNAADWLRGRQGSEPIQFDL